MNVCMSHLRQTHTQKDTTHTHMWTPSHLNMMRSQSTCHTGDVRNVYPRVPQHTPSTDTTQNRTLALALPGASRRDRPAPAAPRPLPVRSASRRSPTAAVGPPGAWLRNGSEAAPPIPAARPALPHRLATGWAGVSGPGGVPGWLAGAFCFQAVFRPKGSVSRDPRGPRGRL